MSKSKYKNLIIVGNGFDCWQNIPTSYENFRLYYLEHVNKVAEELGYKFYSIADKNGIEKKVTAVELIYGDPFNPDNLDSEFFWHLEERMNRIDDQIINLYFGRSKEGIAMLNIAVNEAISLLRQLFCDWVSSIEINDCDSGYSFANDCFVVNFNYTDTVERRFGIPSEDVFHIHGIANDANSIIVGHSTHPEKPFSELIERRFMKPVIPGSELPRIDGLYAVEEVLYKTDKHVADVIDRFCAALMERNVHVEDFESIYVLGHSFAKTDIDYFEFIDAVTRCGCDYNDISPVGHLDMNLLNALSCDENVIMEMILLNVEYAMNHRKSIIPDAKDLFPELKEIDKLFGGQRPYRKYDAEHAVRQRFWLEQAERTQDAIERIAAKYSIPVPDGCRSILDYMNYVDKGHDPRRRNATWHISFHTKDDKKRIEKVMRDLHNKRFLLYDSIDKCIETFKV